MVKKVLVAVGILAVAGAAYLGFRANSRYFSRYPRVYAEMAAREDLVGDLEAAGRVAAGDYRDLYACSDAVAGRILAAEGQKVRPGQLLLRLEAAELPLALAQCESEILRAEQDLARLRKSPLPEAVVAARHRLELASLALDQARRQYDTAQDLFAAGALAKAELERIEGEYRAAEARYIQAKGEAELSETADAGAAVKTAEAALRALRLRRAGLQAEIEALNVRAPIGGRISLLAIREGERVPRGARVAQIVDDGAIVVEAEVAPEDAPRVKAGDAAEIRRTDRTDAAIPAEVAEVLPPQKTAEGYGRTRVRLRPVSGGAALVPGASVWVRILVARSPLAITVPVQAVRLEQPVLRGDEAYYAVGRRSPSPRKYVLVLVDCSETLPEAEDAQRRWMVRDNIYQARKVYIKTGLYGAQRVEVLAGVRPFQMVIVHSDREVYDRDRVIVIRRRDWEERPFGEGGER
ncbi:MAG: efflux RND transporter periplasmic adaptor subunit [Patescibacteria group bacterium]